MTTIVYADGVLAADRQRTLEDCRMTPDRKIVTKGRWALVGCGLTGAVQEAIRTFDPENPHQGLGFDDDSGVLATDGLEVLLFQDNGWARHPASGPVCWGSGGTLAQAAILSGRDAVDAVLIASQIDVYSGDGADYVILSELRRTPSLPNIRYRAEL